MTNALIVVWRESLEAMLVIGVLLAWIGRQAQANDLRRALWRGVAAGLMLAAALAYCTYTVESEFAGAALERFQLAMRLVAAALILQMVLWMHAHGRRMQRALERRADQALSRGGASLGIASLVALAVAREGAETVIFLYGLGMENGAARFASLFSGAAAGFLLALLTAWAIGRGARRLHLATLFRLSEWLLLCIAGALLASSLDRMIGMEWLPPLIDPLWDLAAIFPDDQGLGRFLADFAGYRARPAASTVLGVLLLWGGAFWRMTCIDRRARGNP